MARDIREDLARGEIRGRLHLREWSFVRQGDVAVDGDAEMVERLLQRRAEAAVDEDLRVDAVNEFADLGERGGRLGPRAVEEVLQVLPFGVLGEAEGHAQCEEA